MMIRDMSNTTIFPEWLLGHGTYQRMLDRLLRSCSVASAAASLLSLFRRRPSRRRRKDQLHSRRTIVFGKRLPEDDSSAAFEAAAAASAAGPPPPVPSTSIPRRWLSGIDSSRRRGATDGALRLPSDFAKLLAKKVNELRNISIMTESFYYDRNRLFAYNWHVKKILASKFYGRLQPTCEVDML